MTARLATYDGTLNRLPAVCPFCGTRLWLASERLFSGSWIHQWVGDDGQEHGH